jgi:hypothetical protein
MPYIIDPVSILNIKGKERHTIPLIYAQRLFMGPKYNAATSLEELGSTKTYRRSKRASNVAESQSAKSGQDSQTGAVGCCDGKGKKNLKNWRTQQHTGGENSLRRGSKCQIWPRSQI